MNIQNKIKSLRGRFASLYVTGGVRKGNRYSANNISVGRKFVTFRDANYADTGEWNPIRVEKKYVKIG